MSTLKAIPVVTDAAAGAAVRSGEKYQTPQGVSAIKDGIKPRGEIDRRSLSGKPRWLRAPIAMGEGYDFVRRTVSRQGREIELSRKEFDLLALFASRLGQVVTRETCLDTLWWGLELSDTRTLDTHVKRLRQKVEEDPANPRHLLTIRGVGFRLDA